jgi:hypothetical protein
LAESILFAGPPLEVGGPDSCDQVDDEAEDDDHVDRVVFLHGLRVVQVLADADEEVVRFAT